MCDRIISYNMVSGRSELVTFFKTISLSTICPGPSETIFGFDKLSGNIAQLTWYEDGAVLRKTHTHNLDANYDIQRMCYIDLHEVLVFTYVGPQRHGMCAMNLYNDSILWDLPNKPIFLSTLCADETGRVFVMKPTASPDSGCSIFILDCRTGDKIQAFSPPYEDLNDHVYLLASRSALIFYREIIGLLQSSAKVTFIEVTKENDEDC